MLVIQQPWTCVSEWKKKLWYRRVYEIFLYFGHCSFLEISVIKTQWFLVKGRAKWRLLTIPHFVYNDFISSYRSFMPKLRTCCNTNWLHSNRAENQVSVYAFRGTVALKVALDNFLLKGGHQHRARGRISLKSGKILSVIFHFYRRFSFLLSNQSHSPRRKRHWVGLFSTVIFFS